ncbi:MAG: chloride channel protein [Deltaproteobacteria bacterium]|nr:chloride channel protein [Deltaproteobacteria bacterium]
MEDNKNSNSIFYMKKQWKLLHVWLFSSEVVRCFVLSILVGIIAGLGAVFFRWLIKSFNFGFFGFGSEAFSFLGRFYVVLPPAIGGLLVGYIIYFFAKEAKGEGPSEVMEAVAVKKGRIRPRVSLVKLLASSICIGSGGSVGREGPIVQIGASFGSTVGQWFKLPDEWVKTLLLCGAAGGISATFNAPLGGVFFVMEVVQRRFMAPNLGFIVVASVTADFIAHHFLGKNPSFVIPSYSMTSYWEIIPYMVLGVIAAMTSLCFIRFFYKCEDWFKRFKIPEYVKPALGGLLVGIIGFFYFEVYGVGYGGSYGIGGIFIERGGVDLALAGELGLFTLIMLVILKIVATSLTLGSGGSGGVFAPSLFIGSVLGGAFGIIIHSFFPEITASSVAETSGAYAVVGMGAFFAATVRGPITAIILLFEMTRNYTLILPLMTAVSISMFLSSAFTRESIYTMRLVRRGIDIHRSEEVDILRSILVGDVMTREVETVSDNMTLKELLEFTLSSKHVGFPVLNREGLLAGIITIEDYKEILFEEGLEELVVVKELATSNVITVTENENLAAAMKKIGFKNIEQIPVVDQNNPRKIIGILSRRDIVSAYNKTLIDRTLSGDIPKGDVSE